MRRIRVVVSIAWMWRISVRRWIIPLNHWILGSLLHLWRWMRLIHILWHVLRLLLHGRQSTILMTLHHHVLAILMLHAHVHVHLRLGSISPHVISVCLSHKHWRHHGSILSLHKATKQAHIVFLILSHHFDLLLVHPLILL